MNSTAGQVETVSSIMAVVCARAKADGFRQGPAVRYCTAEERAKLDAIHAAHRASAPPSTTFRGSYAAALRHFGGPVRVAVQADTVNGPREWCRK